jgi:hypothetical protein
MGFEEPRTIVRVQFADPSFAGLEVRAYAAPTDVLEETAELAFVDGSKPVDPATLSRIRGIVKRFADELVSWNLERDGQPQPATVEAVRRLDLTFAWQLVGGWIVATHRVLGGAMQEARQRQEAEFDEAELPPMELPAD